MRLLYVDHVKRLRRAESIEATLLLSPDERIFSFHFPGNPMLPASLLIECFAQAATILLETTSGFTRKAFPGYIRDAKFHRPIRPAHPTDIQVHVEQWAEEGALLRCRAEQEGRVSGVATLGMVTAPLETFFRPEDARAYRVMYQRWLKGASLDGFDTDPLAPLERALVG